MEDFSITTQLAKKEYVKVIYLELYRKPRIIAITLIGCYFVVIIILDQLKVTSAYSGRPYLEIFLSLFSLLYPSFIALKTLIRHRSDPTFQQPVTYTFGEDGFIVQGVTVKGAFRWSDIWRREEINKFLILYHDEKAGNFIDKTKLTREQLQFIKTKVG